jgi:hypothetical protein
MPTRPVTVRPQNGGLLATAVSPDMVGLANYSVKRDFVRDMGSEHRRVGYDLYWPNRSFVIGGQPTPSTRYFIVTPSLSLPGGDSYSLAIGESYKFIPSVGEVLVSGGVTYSTETVFTATAAPAVVVRTVDDDPNSSSAIYLIDQEETPEDITLIARAVRPNGDTAIIVGTPTTLYRQMVFNDPAVYEEGVFATTGIGTPIYSLYNGDWAIIGSGFSENARRWQWVNINGYIVLNNGVDLPVTFRVEDAEAVPIYELRETGVASVGWISSYNGVLFCSDIRQLTEEGFEDVVYPVGFGKTVITFTSNSGSGATAIPVIVGEQLGMITVTNGGSSYTTQPTVEIEHPDGAEGATAEAVITGSPVSSIDLLAGGSGFSVAPTVNITGGSGSGATAVATIEGSPLSGLTLTSGGSSYVSPPKVTFSSGTAQASAILNEDGEVSGFEIQDYGDGYTSPPTVTLTAGQTGGGTTATATVTLSSGALDEVTITNAGSLYINAPEVVVTGDGQDGKAVAMINDDGEVTSIVITDPGESYTTATLTIVPDDGSGATATAQTIGGKVNQITLTNPGSGYLSNPQVTFTGDGTGASAEAKTRGGYVTSVNVTNGGSGFKSAYQTGAVTSSPATADMVSGDPTVTASAATFNGGSGFTVGMVGQTLIFDDGFYSEIASWTSTTSVELVDSPDYNIDDMTFRVVDESETSPDFVVVSSAPFFTEDMVGQQIVWTSGETRTITAFENAYTVRVDSEMPVAAGEFSVSNPDQNAPVTDETLVDRIHYRTRWSNIDDPRSFGASITGSISAGSSSLQLDYPALSLEIGDEVTIDSIGVNGGNLSTSIVSISDGGMEIILADKAVTAGDGVTIQKSDSLGGISGFEDLMDDEGTEIVTSQPLQDALILYKRRAIFSARFTGRPAQPFAFRKEYQGKNTPAYRNAIVDLGIAHVYPSENAFYRYDLGSRQPTLEPSSNACRNIFFDQAKPSLTDSIYSAENRIGKEWFLVFPSTTDDKALVVDTETFRLGTTSMNLTAAATISTEEDPVEIFAAAIPGGTLVQNLHRDKPPESLGAASQTGYVVSASNLSQEHVGYTIRFADGTRRTIKKVSSDTSAEVLEVGEDDVPAQAATLEYKGWHRIYTGYPSTMESGLNDFGDAFNEKDIDDYVVLFGPKTRCNLELTFSSTRNVGEEPEEVGSTELTNQVAQNGVPLAFQFNYFHDKIVVTGTGNPCEIAGKIYAVDGGRSASTIRHI